MAAGAGSASDTGSVWLIDRFDLIFYNGRHRRWQFFAEDPAVIKVAPLGPGEGLHRYQIRDLLATFRQIVLSLVSSGKGKFKIRPRPPQPGDDAKPSIELAAPTSESWWNNYWSTYLDYLIATAWHDGVIDEHRTTLHCWFKNPQTKISRREALTFLSLLPIFEDWDTWGCMVRARRADHKRPRDAFPPLAAQGWSAPLSVVELDYNGKVAGPSATVLAKPVDIEALCLNVDSPTPRLSHSARGDFFDPRYCLEPQATHLLPYRFYAALVDQIMKKLAPGNPDKQFVIAYPLSVSGRLHFLQIALSPQGDQNADVRLLWQHWTEIHRQIWTPPLRAFLREEMQRIVASAFRHEAHSRLDEGIRKGEIAHGDRSRIAIAYNAQLFKCMYHLFPAVSASIPNPATSKSVIYGYEPYSWKKDSLTIEVGSNWSDALKAVPNSKRRRRLTLDVDGASIVVDGHHSNRLEKIAAKHQVRHALAEQKEFLRRLHEGAEDIWKDAEDNRRKCKCIVLMWSQSKNWKTLKPADLNDEPHVEADNMPTGREPFPGRYQPRSIKRYAAQMLNKDDDDKILEGLKSMMRPSLLLQISEYFETGAAKVVSHQTPALYFSEGLDQLRSYDKAHYAEICNHIESEIKRLCLQQALAGDLTQFRHDLTSHINCCSVLNLTCVPVGTTAEDLARRHQEVFRVESFLGIIQNFRCYHVDPEKILKPFLRRVVITDKKRYLAEGIIVQKLNEQYPHEWVPGSEDARVRRVEHFVYLGSLAKAVPPHSRLKKANMLKLWGKDCQAIADLLVHTADSTYVFFDGEFIKDQHLHEQIGTHRLGHEEQFNKSKFWVILRMQVWRTIEDQETTPELDVSSFSLHTIKGALDASCDC